MIFGQKLRKLFLWLADKINILDEGKTVESRTLSVFIQLSGSRNLSIFTQA